MYDLPSLGVDLLKYPSWILEASEHRSTICLPGLISFVIHVSSSYGSLLHPAELNHALTCSKNNIRNHYELQVWPMCLVPHPHTRNHTVSFQYSTTSKLLFLDGVGAILALTD